MLEVLLALALIGVLASILVGGASHLMTDQPVTLNQVFWKSVQEARKAALKSEHEMRLRYDREKRQFVIVDGFAAPVLAEDGFTMLEPAVKTFSLPPETERDVTIEFLSAGKTGNTILIGGVLVESQPIGYVTFFPDGTCMPFRLQVMRAGDAHTLAVDPWTCAPVIETKEAR